MATSGNPRRNFWKTVPLSFRLLFFTGVSAIFVSVGFLYLLLQPRYVSPWRAAITVVVMGGLAVVCAAAGISRRFWLIAIVACGEGVFFAILEYYTKAPNLPANSLVRSQVTMLAFGALIAVVAGYTLFIQFFSRQGARYFRAQNEIALASEIHRALVPRIHRTLGAFELFGASVPSGEVGGDLVDVTGDANSWTAYVADVSGHGVSAGLLMAMFKTAVRTRAADVAPQVLLQEVHRALYPLKTNNMFVTAGFLQYSGNGLQLSLAGHPALLRFSRRTGAVEEYPTLDLPLGVLPEQTFTAVPLACETGDILILLTDGLTEVFDKDGKEMGIEPIKAALVKSSTLPLPELFTTLRQIALDRGHQDDDQTMLLVRKIG